MRRFILSLSCFLMTFAAPISAQDFQKGLEAVQSGDFETALKEWKPLAERGNSGAQYNIGLLYDTGQGVPQDYKVSVIWYRLAAEQGHANAQYNLGVGYARGEGVLADNVLAHMWFNLSGANGDSNGAKKNKKSQKT